MSAQSPTPGSAVVGSLTEVAPWEAELIMSIRFWMDGAEGQSEVWSGFARRFGVDRGRAELQAFERLLSVLCTCARRPLMRHGLGCTCIGSDEAVLCALVREASRGDLAEASLLAGLLVPAGYAEQVALMAAQVGQTMRDMSARASVRTSDMTRNADTTLH